MLQRKENVMNMLLGNVVIQKKIPTITQDLSRRCIAMRGESVSTYHCGPKAEAFSNVVDAVELLRDPTNPSTEHTAPPCSAHVQLDDVPRAPLQQSVGMSSVSTTAW